MIRKVNPVKERRIIVLDRLQELEPRESNLHVHKPFWAFPLDHLYGDCLPISGEPPI